MNNKTVILFQGDSITDGNRIKNNTTDLNHQIGHSYAYIVSGKLGAENPQGNLQFFNRGISGNRLCDLEKRWQEDCLDLAPDILSILVGVNDVHFAVYENKKLCPEDFGERYVRLIESALQTNSEMKIVLCEPFSLCLGGPAEHWEEWHSLLCEVQKQVRIIAEKTGAYFLPLQNMFDELSKKAPPQHWIWDGVHPTESGHWMIAEKWLELYNDKLN